MIPKQGTLVPTKRGDRATRQIPGCTDQASARPGRPALPSSETRQRRGPGGHCSKGPVLSSRPPAPRGMRKQLLTLGHTDLVILENAVFPPRESQKSLGGKVGDGKGSCPNETQTRTQGLAQLVSDLAEAAVMVEKSVSLTSKGLGGEVWRRGTCLAQGRPGTVLGPWGSPQSRPGVWLLRSHSCPDATLGSFSGVRPQPRCPTAGTQMANSAPLAMPAQAGKDWP